MVETEVDLDDLVARLEEIKSMENIEDYLGEDGFIDIQSDDETTPFHIKCLFEDIVNCLNEYLLTASGQFIQGNITNLSESGFYVSRGDYNSYGWTTAIVYVGPIKILVG